MYTTIDDVNLVLYEEKPTDGKRAVILINLENLKVVGEYLVDSTTLSNQMLNDTWTSDWYAHNKWMQYSTSPHVPLITSFNNNKNLLIGVTKADQHIPMEYRIYDVEKD